MKLFISALIMCLTASIATPALAEEPAAKAHKRIAQVDQGQQAAIDLIQRIDDREFELSVMRNMMENRGGTGRRTELCSNAIDSSAQKDCYKYKAGLATEHYQTIRHGITESMKGFGGGGEKPLITPEYVQKLEDDKVAALAAFNSAPADKKAAAKDTLEKAEGNLAKARKLFEEELASGDSSAQGGLSRAEFTTGKGDNFFHFTAEAAKPYLKDEDRKAMEAKVEEERIASERHTKLLVASAIIVASATGAGYFGGWILQPSEHGRISSREKWGGLALAGSAAVMTTITVFEW